VRPRLHLRGFGDSRNTPQDVVPLAASRPDFRIREHGSCDIREQGSGDPGRLDRRKVSA
jgi:hypothetical protein